MDHVYMVAIPSTSAYTLPGGYLVRVPGYSVYEVTGEALVKEAMQHGCVVFKVNKLVGIHDLMNCNNLWEVRFLVGSPSQEKVKQIYNPATGHWTYFESLQWKGVNHSHYLRVTAEGTRSQHTLCGKLAPASRKLTWGGETCPTCQQRMDQLSKNKPN